MVSRLVEIYDTLAQIGVSDGLQDIVGFKHNELPTSITNPPVRVIAPVSMDSLGQKRERLAFRENVMMQWTIPDIALFGKVTSGSGHEFYYQRLMPYIANYVEVVCMQHQEHEFLAGVYIDDWKMSMPIVPYPAKSETLFFAVVFELTILEMVHYG